MATQKEKIKARLKKDYYSDLMVLAATQTRIQDNYMDVIINLSDKFSTILRNNGYIKKLEYKPKEFWNFGGKKTIYNIDGGQASVQIPTAAPFGLRVVNYKVKPGDKSSNREDLISDPYVVTDLFDPNSELFDQNDDDGLADDLKKMQDGTRIIFEAAAALRTALGVLDWPKDGKVIPTKNDMIFLHGPMVNPAAGYEVQGTISGKKYPPYSLETYNFLLPHRKEAELPEHRDVEPLEKYRKFIPIYCEILQKIKKSEVPVYGCVERPGAKPYGPLTEQLMDSMINKRIIKEKDVKRGSRRPNDPDGMADILRKYQISDSAFFDYMLDVGEYIVPQEINKQEEHKWPISQWDYEYWGLGIPKSFSTYLKVSENKKPIRIETMEVRDSYNEDLNMVFHSSRLLKSYSFPVGLDIVDKLAKTPDWMKRNVRKNAIMITLRKAMESGNKRAVAIARKIAVSSDNSFFNRPKGK